MGCIMRIKVIDIKHEIFKKRHNVCSMLEVSTSYILLLEYKGLTQATCSSVMCV